MAAATRHTGWRPQKSLARREASASQWPYASARLGPAVPVATKALLIPAISDIRSASLFRLAQHSARTASGVVVGRRAGLRQYQLHSTPSPPGGQPITPFGAKERASIPAVAQPMKMARVTMAEGNTILRFMAVPFGADHGPIAAAAPVAIRQSAANFCQGGGRRYRLAGNRRTLAWKSRRVPPAGGMSCGRRQRRQSRAEGARLKGRRALTRPRPARLRTNTLIPHRGKSGLARNVSMRSKKRP
jgi:hypothetical protein